MLPEQAERLALDDELADVDVLAEIRALYRRMIGFLRRAEEADNWPAVRAFHAEARKDLELLAKLLGELGDGTINLTLSPQWLEFRAVIVGALETHPEAREAVLAALERSGHAGPGP